MDAEIPPAIGGEETPPADADGEAPAEELSVEFPGWENMEVPTDFPPTGGAEQPAFLLERGADNPAPPDKRGAPDLGGSISYAGTGDPVPPVDSGDPVSFTGTADLDSPDRAGTENDTPGGEPGDPAGRR